LRPKKPAVAPRAPAPPSPPKGTARLSVRVQGSIEYLSEYSQHLARGGLFVRTYEPLPVDTAVELDLWLPFKADPVHLHGQVVRSVPVDSPESRTSGPGMGIQLFDLPPELKLAMEAYVAGLRVGISTQEPPKGRSTVLLYGVDDVIPRNVPTFLHRGGFRVLRASRLGEALIAVRQTQPDLVLVSPEQLGTTPRETVTLLRQEGARNLLAVTDGPWREGADICEVMDIHAPDGLLDRLAERLAIARRTAARVRCAADLSGLRCEGMIGGIVIDLSLGGLSMLTEFPFAIGERFSFQLDLPNGGGQVAGHGRTVRVSRVSTETLSLRVGVAFERLGEDAPELLRKYIESQLARSEARVSGTKGITPVSINLMN